MEFAGLKTLTTSVSRQLETFVLDSGVLGSGFTGDTLFLCGPREALPD